MNAGSISSQGAEITHALWPKNQKQNRSNIVTNSIKTFKMVHIKKKILKTGRDRDNKAFIKYYI